MSEKPYTAMSEAERAALRYTELKLPELRAFVVAHAIRKGNRPAAGQELGFALTISQAEVADPARVTAAEVAGATPQTERVWLWFAVTGDDVAAAVALINEQQARFHNGMTQLPCDEQLLLRLADSLENYTP